MYRRLKTSLVLVALGAAFTAGPASAQSCKAPPGMSAIDQYCEAIPSPAGDRGNTDPDRGGVPIPPAARQALAKSGPDGQSILALGGSASKKEARQVQRGGSAGVPTGVQPDQPSENPLSAVANGFSGTGDTVGPLFGTMLLFFALVFFSLAWLRYRRRAQG